MGVHGLTKKVQETLSVWSADDGEVKFVIDGHALLHYVCTAQRRNFASSYHEFSKIFLDIIQKLDIKRIAKVIFDGSTPKVKLAQCRNRQKERQAFAAQWSSSIHFGQGSQCRDSNNHLKMPFCEEAAIAVLQQNGVDYEIWDEEADERVIAEAQRLGAAAMSQDSDFFLVDIPKGYFSISRFLKKKAQCNYSFSEFCKAFDMSAEQVSQLPAFMGCDYSPVNEKGMFFDEAVAAIKAGKKPKFDDSEWPRSIGTIKHKKRDQLRKGHYHPDLIDVELNGCLLNDVLVEAEDVAWKATQAVRAHVYALLKLPNAIKENRHDRAIMVQPEENELFMGWEKLSHDDLMVQMLRYSIQHGKFNQATVKTLAALYHGGVVIDGFYFVGGNPKSEEEKKAAELGAAEANMAEEEGGEGREEKETEEGEEEKVKKTEPLTDDDGFIIQQVKEKKNKAPERRKAEAERLDHELNDLAVCHANHWAALCASVRMLLHAHNVKTEGWFCRFWCMGEHFFYLRSLHDRLDLTQETKCPTVAEGAPQMNSVFLLRPELRTTLNEMLVSVWKDLKEHRDTQDKNNTKKKNNKKKKEDKPSQKAAPANAFAGLLSDDDEEEEENQSDGGEDSDTVVVSKEDATVAEDDMNGWVDAAPAKSGKNRKNKKKPHKDNNEDGYDDLMTKIMTPDVKVAPPALTEQSTEGLTKAQLKRLKKKQAAKK